MELAQFTTREKIKALHETYPDAVFYDTSTHAPKASDYDFVKNASEFSPFVPYGKIPVPKTNLFSDSVEGVWQGLKIIKDRTDISYFKGKGRKRYGKPKGHMFGDKILNIKEARQKIYIPSYEFMFYNRINEESIRKILKLARSDLKQFFFDVDINSDIGNTDSPLAHSAVLVDIINKELTSEPQLQKV